MKKNEKFYGAYRLYILKPAKIIDIEGHFSKVKSELISSEVEVIEQDITFRTVPEQIVIAEKSDFDKHHYMPILEEDKADEYHSYFGYGHYYDQEKIEKAGLFKRQEKAGFVGLFPNDVISLLDLPNVEFIQSLGKIGPIKRIKYFNHKKQLKSKYHQKLEKIQYTIEDLKELKEHLLETLSQEEQSKIITKSYTVAKEPNKPYFHLDTRLPSRDRYAGTEEDIDKCLKDMDKEVAKAFQKSLNSTGKEFRI